MKITPTDGYIAGYIYYGICDWYNKIIDNINLDNINTIEIDGIKIKYGKSEKIFNFYYDDIQLMQVYTGSWYTVKVEIYPEYITKYNAYKLFKKFYKSQQKIINKQKLHDKTIRKKIKNAINRR